jgi:uncharacterized membrane protein
MISWFKKKQFLTPDDNHRVAEAIRAFEKKTSGEIRVFMESRNPLVNTIERAQVVFGELQMHQTKDRNGVLLYLAVKDREVALLGDEGIHQKVGSAFWEKQVAEMIQLFKQNNLTEGMVKCIEHVGLVLVEKFPHDGTTDQNELSDDIVFGK